MGITINRTGGGLGRQQPGEDYISGLLFKQATLPSGFGTSDRIKKVTTLAEAEALGIDNSHSDETKATGGNVEITAAGATGDVWSIVITPVGASAITLGTYTEQSSDTPALIATGLFNNVNLNTINHGFTATNAVASNVALIAPAKKGASINSGLVSESTGAGTTTVTQFSSGVGSITAINYYHVSEFFALSQKITGLAQGILYIGIYTTYNGSELGLMQNYAEGKIRQAGVFLPDTFASSMVSSTQIQCTTLEVENQPISNVLLTADFTATTLAALADMRALDSKNVSVVIGEDKGSNGGALVGITEISISCLGATLGTEANASVHESIEWRGKFDQIHGSEYENLQFTTGEEYSVQSNATLTEIGNKGYIFLTKEINVNGSFYAKSATSTLITSDFAYIENMRTIDKAARLIRENLVPKISAPLYVNATTGKLSQATIEDFKNDAFKALENMAANLEISTNEDGSLPANSVVIDPDQDVISTSEIILTITIVPVVVARQITVNIGFAVSIA
jgi:hypothetical protein